MITSTDPGPPSSGLSGGAAWIEESAREGATPHRARRPRYIPVSEAGNEFAQSELLDKPADRFLSVESMLAAFSNPASAPMPAGRYSQVVRLELGTGALLLLSGQVAVDDDGNVVAPGDMAAQTRRIFEIIGAILADQGASFSNVVNIRTYLTDIGRLAEYAQVRRTFLPDGVAPTSTTVEVSRLFKPDVLVEVEVTAAIGT